MREVVSCTGLISSLTGRCSSPGLFYITPFPTVVAMPSYISGNPWILEKNAVTSSPAEWPDKGSHAISQTLDTGYTMPTKLKRERTRPLLRQKNSCPARTLMRRLTHQRGEQDASLKIRAFLEAHRPPSLRSLPGFDRKQMAPAKCYRQNTRSSRPR